MRVCMCALCVHCVGSNCLSCVLCHMQREKQLIANSLRADFERAFSNFNNVQTVSVCHNDTCHMTSRTGCHQFAKEPTASEIRT